MIGGVSMSENGSNSDSLKEFSANNSNDNDNNNNNSNSTVATEESSQQVNPEEIERRKREAEELFEKYVLYFLVAPFREHNNTMLVLDNRVFFSKNLIEYLTSSNNHFQYKSFKDFFCEIKENDDDYSDQNYEYFLSELEEPKVPLNITTKLNLEIKEVINRIFEKTNSSSDSEQQNKILHYHKKIYILFCNYKLVCQEFKNIYLYPEILKWYPNASPEQIITATLLFEHSPWHNKWSVFTYFSKKDLDVIIEIYEYFSPIDNPRAFFRYFYDNRKKLSNRVNETKFDIIGSLIKCGLVKIKNFDEFTKKEQKFIIEYIENPYFREIIMEGNVANVNVVKNLYTYCKIYDANPIEVIKNVKLAYKKNYDGAELSNSDLHTLLDVDVIESLSKFKNIINPKFLTVKRIQQISQNEKLKERIVASLINNSFNSFVYNGTNYFPPNYLSQNPEFSLTFLIHSFYIVPYNKNVTAESQSEIMNCVINNFNSINSFFESKKEVSLDNKIEYFIKKFGFSFEEATVAEQFYVNFIGFNSNFSKNLTLIIISILENPSNITSFINEFDLDNSEFFINQFAICINVNEAYREKFIEALANINLNLVPNIFKNSNIAKLYKKEGSNENLKQKVIDKKRELLPEAFDKNSLSDDLLSYLPSSTFEQEKLAKLKDLNDIIFELPDGVIDWAVSAKPDEIPVIKNIATAQSINDIEKNTIQVLIKQKDYLSHPIFSFFAQKLLNKIPFNEVKDEDNKVLNLNHLNKTIIDYASSRAGEGGLSTQEMNNLNFTLSQICDTSLTNCIGCIMTYKNISPQLQVEKAIRDIYNPIMKRIKQIEDKNKANEVDKKKLLQALANTVLYKIMNEKNKGVPDEQNKSRCALDRILEILPEDSLAKTIFLEVADENYENAFKDKLNNLQNTQGNIHPLSFAQSFSQQEDIQL